jgi:hypothetical protein
MSLEELLLQGEHESRICLSTAASSLHTKKGSEFLLRRFPELSVELGCSQANESVHRGDFRVKFPPLQLEIACPTIRLCPWRS